MTPMEELLRAATREAAAEITPESIEPLEVAALRGPSADGPVFILRGGTEQAIPFSSRISGPQGGNPEAAW